MAVTQNIEGAGNGCDQKFRWCRKRLWPTISMVQETAVTIRTNCAKWLWPYQLVRTSVSTGKTGRQLTHMTTHCLSYTKDALPLDRMAEMMQGKWFGMMPMVGKWLLVRTSSTLEKGQTIETQDHSLTDYSPAQSKMVWEKVLAGWYLLPHDRMAAMKAIDLGWWQWSDNDCEWMWSGCGAFLWRWFSTNQRIFGINESV